MCHSENDCPPVPQSRLLVSYFSLIQGRGVAPPGELHGQVFSGYRSQVRLTNNSKARFSIISPLIRPSKRISHLIDIGHHSFQISYFVTLYFCSHAEGTLNEVVHSQHQGGCFFVFVFRKKTVKPVKKKKKHGFNQEFFFSFFFISLQLVFITFYVLCVLQSWISISTAIKSGKRQEYI